jgi:hypothetical protein
MPGPARFYHVLPDTNADADADTQADTVEVADAHAVSFPLWLFDGHQPEYGHHQPE